MPIRACQNCGSDRLVFPTGASSDFTCDDCDWAGTPNEYASWSAWQQARVAARGNVMA